MINENIMNNSPFLLKPAVKSCLWGGTKIQDSFAKEENLLSSLSGEEGAAIGETWECSTNEEGISQVGSGIYEGQLLKEVLRKYPEFLGKWKNSEGELPILVKLIDAKRDLSVQVHPNDAYAQKYENGAMGKTEMWYILDSQQDSELIYGLEHDITKKRFQESLSDGTVGKYLKKVPVKKGDSFFIEAGTIHGIGKGILLAEIQENSNITYRLYDYNRRDKNGKQRMLHIEKGLEVANLNRAAKPKQRLRQIHYKKGYASEMICQCTHFQVERMLLNTQCCREMAALPLLSDSFQILLCTEGCGVLAQGSEMLGFFKGDCIFVPAGADQIRLHGKAEVLRCIA